MNPHDNTPTKCAKKHMTNEEFDTAYEAAEKFMAMLCSLKLINDQTWYWIDESVLVSNLEDGWYEH